MSLSPMMQHYVQTKEQYKDAILFYRLGDFYELFFDDAVLCSKVLELTLTGKDCGLSERAPMCGFPHDSGELYASKLVSEGYKVAICEQLSEPVKGKQVDRGVIRVITPGTVTEGTLLDEKKNNFIATTFKYKNVISIAWADITTGDFVVDEFSGADAMEKLNNTLIRIHPAELIITSDFLNEISQLSCIAYKYVSNIFKYENWAYDMIVAEKNVKNQFGIATFNNLFASKNFSALISAGALIEYFNETQKRTLTNINSLSFEQKSNFMYLDINTRRNLELVETVREKKRKGSLLWLLDETKTNMGARLLRNYVENPLNDITVLNERLNAIEEFTKNLVVRDEIASSLQNVCDLERLCGKISYGSVNPRDCLNIKRTLGKLPDIKNIVSKLSAELFVKTQNNICDFSELYNLLDRAICEDAPLIVKDGGVIKNGFNAELDECRNAGKLGKEWLLKIETEEKEQTGIKNLKIGFNSVFGYYIEVSKGQTGLVPYRYERRQTLTNAERYITPELKTLEQKILGAEEKSAKLEAQLFAEVKEQLLNCLGDLQKTARALAQLDVIFSLSTVAIKNNYCKPTLSKSTNKIEIIEGRHPIVEKINKDEAFVSNDCFLDNSENRTMIITGPNMAGKSTYMRQVALITLMAHIGSFVPAKKANICLTDKIFTRIGASDDLAYGQSTFMVEMVEVANILQNATEKSLILLDEVGRGTATFDGLSIAWAVMEYLSKNRAAKTLFSTHYHELSELEGVLDGVKNYRISVKEFNNSIIFLRKIVRGSALKSFGIEVAKLAGLPEDIIVRAKQILNNLEESDINSKSRNEANNTQNNSNKPQKGASEIYSIISTLDVNKITPMDAQQILFELNQKTK